MQAATKRCNDESGNGEEKARGMCVEESWTVVAATAAQKLNENTM